MLPHARCPLPIAPARFFTFIALFFPYPLSNVYCPTPIAPGPGRLDFLFVGAVEQSVFYCIYLCVLNGL